MTDSLHAPPRRRRRWLEIAFTILVVGTIFAFAFPKLAGAEYTEIWPQLRTLHWHEVAALFVLWMVNLASYTPVLVASLPGLTHGQALTLNLAGSAVSNTVPFGGALGIGTTYSMTRSWGFRTGAVTRSILISGFWNVYAKLALPSCALVFLAIRGRDNAALIGAAVVGTITLGIAIWLLVLVLRTDQLARRVGGAVDWITRRFQRDPADTPWPIRAVEFRHESASLIKAQWRRLSGWIIIYNLGQFAILLAAVRMFEPSRSMLGWTEVFAAFTLGRLLTTIPFTPSGVGFVETGLAGALRGFGGTSAACAAAVLVYSSFTYLLEIPAGGLGWAAWAGIGKWKVATPGQKHSSTKSKSNSTKPTVPQ